jgi:hypothetical protein
MFSSYSGMNTFRLTRSFSEIIETRFNTIKNGLTGQARHQNYLGVIHNEFQKSLGWEWRDNSKRAHRILWLYAVRLRHVLYYVSLIILLASTLCSVTNTDVWFGWRSYWMHFPAIMLCYNSSLWRYHHTLQSTVHWDTPSAASRNPGKYLFRNLILAASLEPPLLSTSLT